MSALRFAVLAGRVDFARELIRRGANVHAPLRQSYPQFEFFKGQTILHAAATRDDPTLVLELLAAGADPRQRDKTAGAYPLEWACGAGNIRVVDAFMEHDGAVA